MANFKLYLEVSGIAEDEYGNPCTASMTIDFGAEVSGADYWTVANSVDFSKLAGIFPLANVTAEDIRVISPEEYAQRYGDGDAEN